MKEKTRKILLLIFLLTGLSLVSSCYLVPNGAPSILVIAVDNLGVNQLNCSTESHQMRSGISLICQDSIRFTHAYTTSILSGPALTSILTGQYPLQHGLRHNGKTLLPGRVKTLAEMAHDKSYATALFSGGAPVLRKLNVHQGFEVFDDSWTPTPSALFKSFSKTLRSFENWLNDLGHKSFFAVFYVPDLVHIRTPTQNELGEARNLSFESQLEEFDESLFELVQSLKSRRWWDSTLVILVGLNGPQLQSHPRELQNTNLFSERTQVGLLIKPPQKPRDQGINWSFDDNVTTADIGKTIAAIFSEKTLRLSHLPLHDLSPALKNPSYDIPERPILIESSWKEVESTRYAFRWGQYLFLLDEEPQAFNSLIDKFENSPIKASDASIRPIWEKIKRIADQNELMLWPEIPRETYIKWKGLVEIWSNFKISPTISPSFERLAHRLKNDPESVQIYNRELLRHANWLELKKWSAGIGSKDLEKIAAKNLKQDIKTNFQDPCLRALEMSNPKTKDLKQCLNPTAFSLLEWVLSERRDLSESAREGARKKFLRRYVLHELDQRIVEMNWALEGVWDISQSLRTRPPIVEMMLALPEMQKYRVAALRVSQQARIDTTKAD